MTVSTFLIRAAATMVLLAPPALAQEAAPPGPPDHYITIHCGHLLAVPGASGPKGQFQDNMAITIKNGVIESVDPDDGKPRKWTNPNGPQPTHEDIDLKQSWVLPGLIDCHVHLTNEWDKTVRSRAMTESPEFMAVRATHYARITLDAGFTTVRDLGSPSPQAIFALRDAIDQKLVIGPRIIAAGHWISMTGGHGDGTNGYRADLIPQPTPDDGICDGPDECIKAVRNQIKLGADVIKVTATGGVLSASTAGLAQHFFDDELVAIVKTAHSLGRKVAAHAHGVDGINAAIRAGVDSIEHGTYLDDESIRLFKQREAEGKKCYHVPTLLAAQTVFDHAHESGYYLPMVARKALLVGPQAKEMFRKSHEAGVRIAFGTDTGVSPHGENAREFKLMVDGGMTPMEAITAATMTASELLGLEKEIGTLEPGKSADVISVSGDPVKDISELERVKFVMRGGAVIKR
jgi:imidazolonepropionase-like amidohydrolase